MRRRAGVIAVTTAAAVLVFAGCGDDEDTTEADTTTDTAAAEGDLDRYCELAAELDQAGQEFFQEFEQQEGATREDFEAAERDFLEQNQADIDEIVAVAPEEVSADAETFVEGLRARAGLSEATVDQQEVAAADQRLNEFEQENCEA